MRAPRFKIQNLSSIYKRLEQHIEENFPQYLRNLLKKLRTFLNLVEEFAQRFEESPQPLRNISGRLHKTFLNCCALDGSRNLEKPSPFPPKFSISTEMSADALRRATIAQHDLVNDIAHQSAWGGYEFVNYSVRLRLSVEPCHCLHLILPCVDTMLCAGGRLF